MVDPLSVSIGIGVAVVIAAAAGGVYLAGWRRSRAPEDIVDMAEVQNYERHKQSAEALRQDIDDE